jgi:hypothetical protein
MEATATRITAESYPEHVPDLRGDSLREQLALRLGRQEAHLRGQRPARTVARRRRGRDRALELGARKTLASPLLPGFGLGLDELFRR